MARGLHAPRPVRREGDRSSTNTTGIIAAQVGSPDLRTAHGSTRTRGGNAVLPGIIRAISTNAIVKEAPVVTLKVLEIRKSQTEVLAVDNFEENPLGKGSHHVKLDPTVESLHEHRVGPTP